MFKLKVLDRSLCLLQVYAPNAMSEYQAFVDEVNCSDSRATWVKRNAFRLRLTGSVDQPNGNGLVRLITDVAGVESCLLVFLCLIL